MKSRGPRRSYVMAARADAAAKTARRILDAAYELFVHHEYEDITLQAVADRAGVTMQTVLRRFGSKDRLADAVADIRLPEVLRSRSVDRPGDVAAAVRMLVDSYEKIGDLNWRMLREEHRFPALHKMLQRARGLHRTWIEQAFAPYLPVPGPARERRVLALFAATDFYQWKLLRRDLRLARKETERILHDSVEALLRGDA